MMSHLWMLIILCSLPYGLSVRKNCHTLWKQLESCISGKDIEIQPIQRRSIVFSVTRTTDIGLSPLQTLVFDKVYLNEGGGYNAHTGLFTAPVNGIYYFAVSFLANGGSTHLLLLKNNHEIARGYGKDQNDTGSVVSTVHLKKGDIIRVAEITGEGREGIRGDGWSSFNGFKLN
ncbi:heavy metal-binding protein HIP-like [Mytilus edulis]|uniref:Putative C1q domain containing protein MgC1q73 n=1 Tax=Mytilus galloprovincialis TaxID=29158 RepID=F0V4B0_MYTGA|nr:putative C1q domain containing protein MgC1q73 [Mytilus galloprovincialis]